MTYAQPLHKTGQIFSVLINQSQATAFAGGRFKKYTYMKALNKMDNLDKGTLLSKLFPEALQGIQNAIEKQCGYFLQNETAFREGWHQKGFFTAEFWYRLVENAHKTIEKNDRQLWKRPNWFADHFFDGHNSLFTVHCLIEYADSEDCNLDLTQAIHLLFGSEKLLKIIPNDN